MQTITLAPTAQLALWPHYLAPDEARATFASLFAEVPFAARAIRLFGREVMQPRLVAWVGDPEAVYTYSGRSNQPLAWTPTLASLRARIARELGLAFNAVLCNLYRDENDAMGMHSDDEPELGARPIVASLSLGAPRRFTLRPKSKQAGKGLDLRLEDGSLLVMHGDTQLLYRHGVPRERAPTGPRINLTFRRVTPRPPPARKV